MTSADSSRAAAGSTTEPPEPAEPPEDMEQAQVTEPGTAEHMSQALASTLSGLLAGLEQDSRQAALKTLGRDKVLELVKALNAGQFDALERQILQPAEDQARALASMAFEGPPLLRYLLTHWSFVSNHVRGLVEQYEGSACCADKTRTILKMLAHHLAHGSPYAFNREQKYTFHLPTKVLLTLDDALSFMEALAHMSQGQTGPYLRWMHRFIQEQPTD